MRGKGWLMAERILCVRLDLPEDVMRTAPAIRALKTAPGRRVTLLTSRSSAGVVEQVPEIDGVVVYEAPWALSVPRQNSSADLAMVERLKLAQFDAAVIFTSYGQSPLPAALLCYLAEIPLRLAHCREHPYHLLTHWVSEPQEPGDDVQRHLALVAAVSLSHVQALPNAA